MVICQKAKSSSFFIKEEGKQQNFHEEAFIA
jgi:hypothetical protein